VAMQGNIIFGRDWKSIERFLQFNWNGELEQAVNKALKWGALFLVAEVRRRIDAGQYVENAPYTIAKKGHSRVLIDKGRMIKSLHQKQIRKLTYEIGFLKDQATSDGKSTLFKVIPILHEGGTFTVIDNRGRRVVIRIPPRPEFHHVRFLVTCGKIARCKRSSSPA